MGSTIPGTCYSGKKKGPCQEAYKQSSGVGKPPRWSPVRTCTVNRRCPLFVLEPPVRTCTVNRLYRFTGSPHYAFFGPADSNSLLPHNLSTDLRLAAPTHCCTKYVFVKQQTNHTNFRLQLMGPSNVKERPYFLPKYMKCY